MNDPWRDSRALVDAFFHQRDTELLQQFRDHLASLDRKAQLADASGIHDDAVLEQLLKIDIGPETLAALSLIPLVEVAWADGVMHQRQKEAVMEAAAQSGILPSDDAYSLLQRWLEAKPEPELMSVWTQYVSAVASRVDANAFQSLKHGILDRARRVARSTGGILGLGAVTREERLVLDQLASAFEF